MISQEAINYWRDTAAGEYNKDKGDLLNPATTGTMTVKQIADGTTKLDTISAAASTVMAADQSNPATK
jgi:hypothetical protein